MKKYDIFLFDADNTLFDYEKTRLTNILQQKKFNKTNKFLIFILTNAKFVLLILMKRFKQTDRG